MTRLPARNDRCISGDASGSTPTMRVARETDRSEIADPDRRPPPPTGTTTVASGSASWASSSAQVACARDYSRVIVGVDDRRPKLACEIGQQHFAVILVAVVLDHGRAVALRGGAFGRRCVARHQDRCSGPQQRRGERDSLCVVARRGRHDSTPSLLGCQLRNGVVCAAKLERAHPLKALRLEHDMRAQQLIERPRRDQRGSMCDPESRRAAASTSANDGGCRISVLFMTPSSQPAVAAMRGGPGKRQPIRSARDTMIPSGPRT